MSTVISVEKLSKAYQLGQIGTGRPVDDLKVWWARKRGQPNPLLQNRITATVTARRFGR